MDILVILTVCFLVIVAVGVIVPVFVNRNRRYVISLCKKNGEMRGQGVFALYDVDASSFPQKLKDAMVEGERYFIACRRRYKLGEYQYYFANDYVINFVPQRECDSKLVGNFELDGDDLSGFINCDDKIFELGKSYKVLVMLYGKYHEEFGVPLIYLGEE